MPISPLPLLIILAVIALGIFSVYRDRRRREALALWAAGRGWRLRRGKLRGLDREYPALKLFGKGHSRRASNVVSGEFRGHAVQMFDYTYVTGSGKNRSTHQAGVVILKTGFPVIPLTIRRESALDRVGEFFGADDIDFESAEFSRKFFVKSSDRKWAYDVIHQRVMDYLLAAPAYDIACGGFELAVTKRGRFDPAGYESALKLAADFHDLIPDYVVRQMKGESR